MLERYYHTELLQPTWNPFLSRLFGDQKPRHRSYHESTLFWHTQKYTNASYEGYTREFIALPNVNDTYTACGKTKQLSDIKLSHLKQMCSNYNIQHEEWHELVRDLS